MDKFKHLDDIFHHRASHCGFWHGVPHHDAQKKLFDYFGVKDDFDLCVKLDESFHFKGNGSSQYDSQGNGGEFELRSPIPGADLTDDDVDIIETLNWPKPEYNNYDSFKSFAERAKPHGIPLIGGAWSSFFTRASAIFGMENYFVKMHTDPEIVTAVADKIIEYFLGQNQKFIDDCGDLAVGCFFGIDIGTQIDLFVSPECFRKFILPYFVKLVENAHKNGKYAFLHSCGSVAKAIPDIINVAHFDALHPIQALATGMSAVELAEKYYDKIVFVGGVDTQVLLREGSPEDIKKEVRRLKGLFGHNYIMSPSHETIMPDVPPENVAAMAEAAHE
ncbi:hypothetical protein FACS1894105_08060 [Clostridia bacterium]|nr:hypothetical protein FACS1894105_08060 [Clostridia bacterium]